jgi:hypothetical protein
MSDSKSVIIAIKRVEYLHYRIGLEADETIETARENWAEWICNMEPCVYIHDGDTLISITKEDL